jgi:hypothetical protein
LYVHRRSKIIPGAGHQEQPRQQRWLERYMFNSSDAFGSLGDLWRQRRSCGAVWVFSEHRPSRKDHQDGAGGKGILEQLQHSGAAVSISFVLFQTGLAFPLRPLRKCNTSWVFGKAGYTATRGDNYNGIGGGHAI